MILIPAIDIKDQQCVRLKQGDYNQKTVFNNDPVAQADIWFSKGASRLHLVDLDGALVGEAVNHKVIENICKNHQNKEIQIGGGIRSLEQIERYLTAGITYCIIGTKAISNPEFLKQACDNFANNIILGLDTKDLMIATHGWKKVSDVSIFDYLLNIQQLPLAGIIHTDIAKDGMMQGASFEQTQQVAKQTKHKVYLSGGVTNMADIKKLAKFKNDFSGAIIGRALYQGDIKLDDAIELVKNEGKE